MFGVTKVWLIKVPSIPLTLFGYITLKAKHKPHIEHGHKDVELNGCWAMKSIPCSFDCLVSFSLWNIIQNWFQLGDKLLRALLFMSNPRHKTGVTTSDGCVPSSILRRTKASNWHSLFNVVTQKIKLQDLWGGILWVYLIQSPQCRGNHPGGDALNKWPNSHSHLSVLFDQ